jgi:ketosteroid isomerase-like protein
LPVNAGGGLELQVRAGGDVGFCWFVYHVSGTLQDRRGDRHVGAGATVCCQRIDGEWQVVHDHESVPFDPATGQAELGLSI